MSEDIRKAIRLAKFDRNDLARLAARLGAGKGAVEKDFLISIFFLLLAFDKQFAQFAERAVFRGGTCIKKAYYPSETRFSEDLDFASLSLDEMTLFLGVLEGLRGQDFGVTTITQARKTFEDSRGLDISLDYTSVLGQPNHIMFNLSTSKSLRNPERRRIDVAPYFASLMPVVPVMDIEEILAEKLRALLQRVKPRDVFDVWFLVKRKMVKIDRRMLDEKLIRNYEAAPEEKKGSAAFYSHLSVIERMGAITETAWKQELGGLLVKGFPTRPTIASEVSEILKGIGDLRVGRKK
jgi:predicted nucleotidyltransferase component of viral defense system